MMRGFSLIEIMIAFTVMIMALVAVSFVAYGSPQMVMNGYFQLDAANTTDAQLTRSELAGKISFASVLPTSTTTTTKDAWSVSVELVDDDIGKRVTGTVSWKDAGSKEQLFTLRSLVTDFKNAALYPCDPFLSGNWSIPRILGTYQLVPGDLLPNSVSGNRFSISAMTTQGTTLAVAISSTTNATDPTLFFFDVRDPSVRPAYIPAAFDNATASRNGYVALAMGPGILYAANGFGSASCPTGAASCAQLHVFDLSHDLPERIATFRIPTTTPTSAINAAGASAAGSALAYRDGFVYAGLEKTVSGQEFVVINTAEPSAPRVAGGFRIGRSVSNIATDGTMAYLTTDDNSSLGKALVSIDVHNPEQPEELSSYRFPGGGYARQVIRTGSRLYIGRSYATGASEEFPILDRTDPHNLVRTGGIDIGTTHSPGGVRGIVIRDFLAFVLSETMLRIWNVSDVNVPAGTPPFASVPISHGTGTALTCRNNILYIGSVDSSGTGYITTVTSS